MEEIQSILDELKEQVGTFFSRKVKKEGLVDFAKHRQEMLEKIPLMDEVIDDYPVYGVIAFLGKFKFDISCQATRLLVENPTRENLEKLREKKKVKLAESAREGWFYLYEKKPDTLAVIVATCFVASLDDEITNCL